MNSFWWCWWFGYGHGVRAMIESYPLICIGFATFFDYYLKNKKTLIVVSTLFIILFNIKSVDLYRANVIHYDSMTAKAFFYTTFKINFSEKDKKYIESILEHPDYEKALKANP